MKKGIILYIWLALKFTNSTDENKCSMRISKTSSVIGSGKITESNPQTYGLKPNYTRNFTPVVYFTDSSNFKDSRSPKRLKLDQESACNAPLIRQQEKASEPRVNSIRLYQNAQKPFQTYPISDPRFSDSLQAQRTIEIPLHSDLVVERKSVNPAISCDRLEGTDTHVFGSDDCEEEKNYYFKCLHNPEYGKHILKLLTFYHYDYKNEGFFRSARPAKILQDGKVASFKISHNKKVTGIRDSMNSQIGYYIFVRWDYYNNHLELEKYLKINREKYIETQVCFEDLLQYLKNGKEDLNMVIKDAEFDVLVYQKTNECITNSSDEKCIWDLLDEGGSESLCLDHANSIFSQNYSYETKPGIHRLINECNFKLLEYSKVKYTGVEVGRKLIVTEQHEALKMEITYKTVDLQINKANEVQSKWKLKRFDIRFTDIEIKTSRKLSYRLLYNNLELEIDCEK